MRRSRHGDFGEYGDPYSDTWERDDPSGITLPADVYIHDRRDELVIRTTVGRDRDEKYAAGTFIRAAGVTGANVAATGVPTAIWTLHIRFGGVGSGASLTICGKAEGERATLKCGMRMQETTKTFCRQPARQSIIA